MRIVKGIDDFHDLYAKFGCFFVVAITVRLAFLFHQDIHSLCHTYHTKHSSETISVDEAFFCKEVIGKEAAFFYFEFNTGIHVTSHDIHDVRKLVCFKVSYIFGSLSDITKDETAKGIGTAAVFQAIIAAGDDIIILKLRTEHLMICKRRRGED